MISAKTGVEKIVVEAVVIRADGSVENLGKIVEIKNGKSVLSQLKKLLSTKG